MNRIKIELYFDDHRMGHPDFGWMRYSHDDEPDDIDSQYIRHIKFIRPDVIQRNPKIANGILYLDARI